MQRLHCLAVYNRVCLIQHQNSCYFRRPDWKTNGWQKSKPTWKLKHAVSILEYFEYFCQILSKSIVIILSYTVSKFVRFLRHSVHFIRDAIVEWCLLEPSLHNPLCLLQTGICFETLSQQALRKSKKFRGKEITGAQPKSKYVKWVCKYIK